MINHNVTKVFLILLVNRISILIVSRCRQCWDMIDVLVFLDLLFYNWHKILDILLIVDVIMFVRFR